MLFQWPTIQQTIYRFGRLRRLILCAVSIPLAVLVAVSLRSPELLSASHASLAALMIAGVVTAHAIFFPNVTLETLAVALASTVLALMMPAIKAVSLWAPPGQDTGALIILMGFAVAATGVLTILFQILLGALVYAGPFIAKRLTTTAVLPCSPEVAFQQFALRPQARRGRVLTGPADEKGFFDVAVAAIPDAGEDLDLLPVVRLDAKVMQSSRTRHDVMLYLRNGTVTVTSICFDPVADGCAVTVSDLPGDFTAGMHLLFWLTDQQADNITETADMIIGQERRANGLSHHGSLLAAAGAVLSPRPPATQSTE